MATVQVDQAKLVLNSFAAIFQNNLISKDLVTWRKHDSEMNDRNRLTVVEQVGPRYTVSQTVDGVADLTGGVQDTVFGSEQYVLNRVFGSSMGWGDWQQIRDIGAARESEALKNAALNLAEQIDAYILGYATLASNNWTGTAGAAVADFDDVASGFTRLKEEGVEDPDLRAVLTYSDKQALGSAIINDNASLPDMGQGTYREGFTGSIAGVPTLFTQQLPTLTTGSRGTSALVTGTIQNVNYADVSISPAPGQYMTQTLNIDIGAGVETVKDGEVFTIDGVYAYDNRLQASLSPRLQQFRVVGDHTAVGGIIAAMRFFPAIIVPGITANNNAVPNAAISNVNTANATVAGAPTATATVNWLGTASTAYKPRLLMNKQAVIVNTADLITPATGTSSRKALSKVPLSVRMWQDSVFATGEHRIRFDVALTANVVDRRRLVRINGS